MRLIRQCCGGICHAGKDCEERAYLEYRKRHGKHWFIMMISSPFIAFLLGLLIGSML